jgi:hypothetical protein
MLIQASAGARLQRAATSLASEMAQQKDPMRRALAGSRPFYLPRLLSLPLPKPAVQTLAECVVVFPGVFDVVDAGQILGESVYVIFEISSVVPPPVVT